MDYLSTNHKYWETGCEAPNVESFIFKAPGHLFTPYNIDMKAGIKLLDFGCGQGSACRYFRGLGADVYGVDISKKDIEAAKNRMPDIKENFVVIDSKPKANDIFLNGNFDIILAVHSLYYYNNDDFQTRLESLYNMLKPGGHVFFTMISPKNYYFRLAKEYKDGLYKVTINDDNFKKRQPKTIHSQYIIFTQDEDDLKRKFSLFEPLEIGYYDIEFTKKEGSGHHYIFFGQKPLKQSPKP